MIAAPFHAGERAMQARAGSRERMAEVGPLVIRDHMPEQHRLFFAQLPFVVVGSVDAVAQPWASLLAAPAGFARSDDPTHLRVDVLPDGDDPLAGTLRTGAALGLLGIEPHTRRRNRMNGVVVERDAEGFAIEVQQSFGNCPKYIQARQAVFAPRAGGAVPEQLRELDDDARRLIAEADTFFIATSHPRAAGSGAASHGVDVSHRGGRPGFVKVDGNTLTVPEFSGNRFYNTLGNIALHPRAGLLFLDYESGDVLHVAVGAQVVEPAADEAPVFEGAERFLRFQVDRVIRRRGALRLRWGEAQLSPHLALTGAWSQSNVGMRVLTDAR